MFAPRLSQSATNKGRETSTLCLVKDLMRMERHGEGLRTRCAFINKVLRKKVQNKAVPLRVITSVAGPCPRIIQRNLKILLTQLKSKIKKKPKFGEFSKFPFPSMSRFPYRDRPVAGSRARPRPAERGALPPHTSDKEQPAESPAESRPRPREAEPGWGAAKAWTQPRGATGPWGSSVAGLRGPLRVSQGPFALPSALSALKDETSRGLRRSPGCPGGCPAALLAAGSGGGSSAFLIYRAAPGRRPGNVPSGGFFCRAPSYAPAALHF